jgi:hypothetical protein
VQSAAREEIDQLHLDKENLWDSDLSNAYMNKVSSRNYLNFDSDFKKYSMNSKNLLAFKACSLFSKNKLLEDPLIHILCDTSMNRTRSTWEINITLTYIPMQSNLNISSRMMTYEPIESIPKLLSNIPFTEPLVQSFSIKMIGCLKAFNLPKIIVSLHSPLNHSMKMTRFEMPVPFTINKFISFEEVSEDFMIDFIQNSIELNEVEMLLDDQLLVRAEDIIELLPNVLLFEESLFCFYLDFGGKNVAALKIEIIDELKIKVNLYSSENADLYQMFMDWFIWMFQKRFNH